MVAANFVPSAEEARAVQPVQEKRGALVCVHVAPELVEMQMQPIGKPL